MKRRILKLAKRLGKFSFDEIALISEIDEDELLDILNELEKEKKLTVRNNTYFYLGNIQAPKKQIIKKKYSKIEFDFKDIKSEPINIKDLKGYQEYTKLTGYKKKHVDKYLKLLSLTAKYKGNQLKQIIKGINHNYPELKTSYSNIMSVRNKIRRVGLTAIIPDYGKSEGNTSVNKELYDYFKHYYLKFNGPNISESIELAKKKFTKKHPDKNIYFPTHYSFRRLLYKEFSKDEIDKSRTGIDIRF